MVHVLVGVVAFSMLLVGVFLPYVVSHRHPVFEYVLVALVVGASAILCAIAVVAGRRLRPTVEEIEAALAFEITCRPAFFERIGRQELLGTLKQEFGCDQLTIRHALLRLQRKGLITFENGKVVRGPEWQSALQPAAAAADPGPDR